MILPRDAEPTALPGSPVLFKRQQVVTLTVSASDTATSAAAAPKKESFPIAIAIPALVGGMAAAILGALLYWYMAKRRRASRQKAREAYERRRRKRANTNASSARPSMSNDRRPSMDQKSPIKEKGFIPPVPVLPKHAQTRYGDEGKEAYDHREYGQYSPQPSIESQEQEQLQRQQQQHYSRQESYLSNAPLNPESNSEFEENAQSKPQSKSRPSRSAARVAVAESAAEKAFGDPTTRYNPKKPSPLAIKAQQEKEAAGGWGEGPFRSGPASPPRAATTDSQRLSAGAPGGYAANANRAVSGEWGVALGSPNHDASFTAQIGTRQNQRTSYSDDPYLQSGNARAKSGVYSSDPYASYHDDEEEEIDYHRVAGNMGLGDGSRSKNWV